MKPAVDLYEAIYVSTMAPGLPITSVGEIASKARVANEASGVTGMLIFDGMRYCQQIEGARQVVLTLMERIRSDPRHVKVEILHHGKLASRRFRAFSLGYTTIDDADVLAGFEKLEGEAAVSAFQALLVHVDFV